MAPGPNFKFEWAYIEWYDSTQDKWRVVWHDFTENQWEEDGAFRAFIIVDPNATVYYGFKIKNEGDAAGTCAHRLEDTVNNRTLKRLTTPDLAPGGTWEEQLESWTADKYMAVKMLACHYENGTDYIHHETSELIVRIRTTPTPTPTPTPTLPDLKIKKAYYSLDGGSTWTEIYEGSTVHIPEGSKPRFKVHIRNEGNGASYERCAWLREGYGCGTAIIGANASDTELGYWDTEDIEFDASVDMKSDQSYSFHVKDGQYIPGCPSDDEFDFYNVSLATPTPTLTPTPTPTVTPTGTPTPSPTFTPTPTPTPTPNIKAYLECLFPRIFTGDLTPRITTGDLIPRITCLNRVGIPKFHEG